MHKTVVAVTAIIALAIALPAAASHYFSDVPSDHAHHEGISWVSENGITSGCEGDAYCPEDPVTRAQMATFLHRYDQQHQHEPGGTVVKQHVVSVGGATVAHCPEGTFVVGGGFQFSGQEQHEVYASYPVTRQQGFNVEGWSVGVNNNGSIGSVVTSAVCLEVTSP